MTDTLSAALPLPSATELAPKRAWHDYGVWAMTFMALIVPFAGIIVGVFCLWVYEFDRTQLSILVSMYVLTVLGITVGFHRLFTHRSFETNRVVQSILVILGSMALQGPLLKWVAMHRMHHSHSDMEHDPHSPVNQKKGFFNWLKGAWHAHIGWFFDTDPPDLYRYVKDLQRSRLLRVLSDLFPLWVFLGLLIPAVLGGVLTHTWEGALMGFLWGGLARIFLVHHVTWSINSICHLWGRRPFQTKDQSRNNFIMGILALGEGWHNNHHAFPVSARHGLRWWQIDVSYWVIVLMSFFGMAKKIRVPVTISSSAQDRTVKWSGA